MKYKDIKILSIKYHDRVPFEVITEKYTFDFEANGGDEKDLIYRITASGIRGNKITVGTLGFSKSPPECQIWKDQSVKLAGNKKGYKILKNPILLNSFECRSSNPFKVSRKVDFFIFCKKCEKWFDPDGCERHGVFDETEF